MDGITVCRETVKREKVKDTEKEKEEVERGEGSSLDQARSFLQSRL